MSRRRTKEGYLNVKQAGRSAFGKSWKRKWVVVQPNNTRSQIGELAPLSLVLELYIEKGAHGKTVTSVLVEGATEIRRVVSKNQSFAFEVRKDEKVLLTAAGESETDSQEWMAMFRNQLLYIRKKELSRLPEAREDAYRVSVLPNKYSEGLTLSGDVLAHITNMTFGLYDVYGGTLIREWDLRHTKRFTLQSKGPVKDVDRIAAIQISNRCPHGEGELIIYSLNAKAFLEKIYENLNSAMNIKSKRTRTTSMFFEIPLKELEALGKVTKEEKPTNGEGTNGSVQKEETRNRTSDSSEAQSKDHTDAGTQLSEKDATEEMKAEPDKDGSPVPPKEEIKDKKGDKAADDKSHPVQQSVAVMKETVENGTDTVDESKKDDTNAAPEDGVGTLPRIAEEKASENESNEETKTSKDSTAAEEDSSKDVEESKKEQGDEGKEVEKVVDNTQQTEVEVHAIENPTNEEKSSEKSAEDILEPTGEVLAAETKADTERKEDVKTNEEAEKVSQEVTEDVPIEGKADINEDKPDAGKSSQTQEEEDDQKVVCQDKELEGEEEKQQREGDAVGNVHPVAEEKGEEKEEDKESVPSVADSKEDENVNPPESEQKETLDENPAEDQNNVSQDTEIKDASAETGGDTKKTNQTQPDEPSTESTDQVQSENSEETTPVKDEPEIPKEEESRTTDNDVSHVEETPTAEAVGELGPEKAEASETNVEENTTSEDGHGKDGVEGTTSAEDKALI